MVDLWVKLYSVKAPALIGNGHIGTGVGMGHQCEALRHLCHIIAVAHPGNALLRKPLEQFTIGLIVGHRFTVLPGSVLLGFRHHTAQSMGHQLAAVTDSQNGNAQLENLRRIAGSICGVDTVGTAGENNPDGIHRFQLFQRSGIGLYLAIDIALANTARNQLIVLSAKIQDNNEFMLHDKKPSFLFSLDRKHVLRHDMIQSCRRAFFFT